MSDQFTLKFATNVVHYTVGKQGAARTVPLVMTVDASNETLVQDIGRLAIDRQSFVKAVQAVKKCGEKSHVQVYGSGSLYAISLVLTGKGPAKKKREIFEAEGSVHRITVTAAAENAAEAEIIIRTTGKSEELAQWMVKMAGFDLSATFEAVQSELDLDGKE